MIADRTKRTKHKLLCIRCSSAIKNKASFTMAEMIVVILIISLFVSLAVTNLSGLIVKGTFKVQAHDLVSTIQMAARAANETDKRYEVIIDITEQYYMLREITSSDLSVILEDEIIVQNDLGKNCIVSYVQFDDGDFTNDGNARFRVGKNGWQYGGKIVMLDSQQKPYTIVINRINTIVTLKEGDVDILTPKHQDEMLF